MAINKYKNLFLNLATLYVGYIKYAPGTFGSILAVILYFPISNLLNTLHIGIIILLLFIIGIFASNYAQKILNKEDPKEVVIDEFVAMWLILFVFNDHLDLYYTISAFILFRFFDILKPRPISFIEKKFKNGFGIMIDDIFAALYSISILSIIKIATILIK